MPGQPFRSSWGLLVALLWVGGCSLTPTQVRSIEPQAPVVASPADSATPRAKPNSERDPEADRLAKTDGALGPNELPGDHGGPECLAELRTKGVAFVALDSLRGVETPVEIRGPIGPVTFWVNGGGPLRLDCRLALTLRRLGPLLEAHQVTRARFSGAYVFRVTRGGRLSHHAHGLALDIHELVLGGQQLSVSHDFLRQAQCTSDAPALNRLACALRATGVFEELLTPDFNADHRDHLHVSVRRSPATLLALAAAREQEQARVAAERKAAQATLAAGAREVASAKPVATHAAAAVPPLAAAIATATPTAEQPTPSPETSPPQATLDAETGPPPPPPLPPAPALSPEAGSDDEPESRP